MVTEAVTVSKTTTKRPTYKQDWPNYNAAESNEEHKFMALAHDLCQTVPLAPGGRGRPPLPISDVVFAALLKVYLGKSARWTQCDLREAFERRLITRAPHYNAIPNCLENPAMTPLLHNMIITTSLPFGALEVDFAADSSGFTGTNYTPGMTTYTGEERTQMDEGAPNYWRQDQHRNGSYNQRSRFQ